MLSLIVAMTENFGIGINNNLPWRLREDLKHFKEITTGKTMIMGRRTFESLPRVLPNRKHVVITNNNSFKIDHPDVTVVHSLEAAIAPYKNASSPLYGDEPFIIGGGAVYAESLKHCDKLYITEVYADIEVDVFFPSFDKNEYELISQSEIFTDKDSGISYRYTEWLSKQML